MTITFQHATRDVTEQDVIDLRAAFTKADLNMDYYADETLRYWIGHGLSPQEIVDLVENKHVRSA